MNVRRNIGIILLCVLVVTGAYVYWGLHPEPFPDLPPEAIANDTTVRVVATGNILPDDSLILRARKEDQTYDFFPMMAQMEPYMKRADVRMCTQQVSSGGFLPGIQGWSPYNAPSELAGNLAALGCNVMNFGTSRIFDKGVTAIDATLAAWEKQENILASAGINRNEGERNAVRYFKVRGVRFAMVSFAASSVNPVDPSYAVTQYEPALAQTLLDEARLNASIVIAAIGWSESEADISVTMRETAQSLSNFGADLVIGNGPRKVLPVQRLRAQDGRETIVWYGLGNFLTGDVPVEQQTGCLLVFDVDQTKRTLKGTSCMPTYMHYEWPPTGPQPGQETSRDKFILIPLDQAKELIMRTPHQTTVQEQTERIRTVLNRYMDVNLIASKDL